jgi:hypothetical protein
MTKEQLKRAVEAWISERRNALAKLTDETAVDVTVLFEQWQPDRDYTAGQRLKNGDRLYRVVQSHHSQSNWRPANTPALFTEIAKPGEIPVWKQPTGAQDAYMTGDKVHFPTITDPIYRSTVDNNVWQPGVYGWEIE